MMGLLVHSEPRNLGFYPVVAAAAAGSGPAAPVVLAVAAGLALFLKLFHFGPDPRKRPDTLLLEAAQESFNKIWEAVSGETLTPLFAPQGSAYDRGDYAALPYGQFGNPQIDMDAAIQSAAQTFQEAASYMQRPESIENMKGNFAPLMARLNAVKQARASQPVLDKVQQMAASLPPAAWAGIAAAVVALVVLT